MGEELTDGLLDVAVADAVYVLLRGHPELELSVDGWSSFYVLEETTASLRAVGIMTLLPTGELPMEVELSREADRTRYSLSMGLADTRWTSLSESKRWKSVYLYANRD